MAQTTVYTCDICKQSKSKDDLAHIEVKTSGIHIKKTTRASFSTIAFDVCPDCLKKKGFVVEVNNEDAEQIQAQNAVTLEDKIYDFLRDMGVVFEE